MNASASFYLYIPTQMRIKIYQTKNKHPIPTFFLKKMYLASNISVFLAFKKKKRVQTLKNKRL